MFQSDVDDYFGSLQKQRLDSGPRYLTERRLDGIEVWYRQIGAGDTELRILAAVGIPRLVEFVAQAIPVAILSDPLASQKGIQFRLESMLRFHTIC